MALARVMKIFVNKNRIENKQNTKTKSVGQGFMKSGMRAGASIWNIFSSIEQSEERKIRK